MTTFIWIICIYEGIRFWFFLGKISERVRFGTWHKNPLVPLHYSGSVVGSLQLNLELFRARISGPIVSIKYLWMRVVYSTLIGYKKVTNEAFSKLLEP